MEVANTWASQSGHWYQKDGTPAYEVPAKKGGMRRTTIADARRLDLIPSVTTIIKCASSFGLERWKAEQLLMAGLTLPRHHEETDAEWIKRVWADSQEQASRAAERGTEIHAAIEAFYRGEWVPEPSDRKPMWPWVKAADDAITSWFGVQSWRAEKSFAHPLGYGGKVDLHSRSVLLDIKTKDSLDGVKLFDEMAMQLAAYTVGLGHTPFWTYGGDRPDDAFRFGIVFVSRSEPNATIIEASAEEIGRGWRAFRHLLGYWQTINDFEVAA